MVKLHKKPWELCNLKDDPTEINNLVKQKALKAASIESIWNNTAGEIGIGEWPVK